MTKSYPILTRFLVVIVLPLAIFIAMTVHHMLSSLPEEAFELVGNDGSSVSVQRNEQGVPRIVAEQDAGVYFAMGYLHAQDRLWQLEFQRRFAQGRLSEVLGKATLKQDAWMRTLGIYPSARSAWDSLSDAAKASLTAYSAGVNSWLAEEHPLPIEFYMFSLTPEPWDEIDSLAWIKVFALNLAGNLDKEIAKYIALQTLSPAQTASFFAGPEDAPTHLANHNSNLIKIGELQRQQESQFGLGIDYAGSNAWAVSGELTESGHAILANDPHLGLQIPSLWYPVAQQGQQLQATGMSIVGLPVVVFGKNQFIAWGGTNLTADVQDLVFERIDPDNGDHYEVAGEWQTVEKRIEEIKVAPEFPGFLNKEIAPIKIEVRQTRNGPIISDVNGRISQPVSLRWTALRALDKTYESFYRASYARDWETFQNVFADYVAPAMNMLYADNKGNIGHLVVGDIPIRGQGDGSIPVPGWDTQFDWQGSIPFVSMHRKYNPPEGILVSANDNPLDNDYPYFISDDWAPPERALRIRQRLLESVNNDKKIAFTLNEVIQSDVVSLTAQKLLPELLRITPETASQKRALEMLAQWQGSMDKNSVEASIYNTWMRHIGGIMFASVVSEDWTRSKERYYLSGVLSGARPDQIHRALQDPNEVWCKRSNAKSERHCETLLREALGGALIELTKLAGDDWDDWQWGELHQTLYIHQPFSQIKGLSSLFERRVPSSGAADTVKVSGYQFHPTDGYNGTLGAGYRQIVELNPDAPKNIYMNSTGQSANLFSKHYADMVEPFEQARYFSFDVKGESDAGK